MTRRLAFAASAIAMLLLLPLAASAHLAAGQDTTLGRYIVDIGYDPKAPRAGEPVTLAFNLVDASTDAAVAPKAVFVRITKGDELVFAGPLEPQPENVTFTFAFPSAGEYQVLARFVGTGGTEGDVEEKMPLTVLEADPPPAPAKTAPAPSSGKAAAAGLAGALLLFELCLYFGYTEAS